MNKNNAQKFRELLNNEEMTIIPGGYDCVTAKLIEQAGFDAVYMSGAWTSAARLGFPDIGLTTMTEMVENAGNMANAVNIPLIADADTGFGNELNTIRTVQEYEKKGVAAIHIEDQNFPKKCGHLDNKEVIDKESFISKICAAVQEKRNPDFTIIARTDSRAVLGFEEAIIRANLALEAGADIAFVEAPQTIEEIKEIPKKVNGPCLFNVVRGGKSPDITIEEVERSGYKVAIFPTLMISALISSANDALSYLKEKKDFPLINNMLNVNQMFQIFGSNDWNDKQKKYQP